MNSSAVTLSEINKDEAIHEIEAEIEKKIAHDIQNAKTARIFSDDKVTDETAKDHIKARLLWSDAVSEVDKLNELDSKRCTDSVIARIAQMGHQNSEEIYHAIIKNLQEKTAITVAFRAELLPSEGITSFQLGNFFERGTIKPKSYGAIRDVTEHMLFEKIKNRDEFLKTALARARYGAFLLLDDHDQYITGITHYGKSFLLLKHVVKLNSLFVPSDSVAYRVNFNSKGYRPCTSNHFETLLDQCDPDRLRSLIDWVVKGKLTKPGYDISRTCELNGYMEALLPAVNILDSNQVELIVLDEGCVPVPEVMDIFTKIGIKISLNSNPYQKVKDVEVKDECKSVPKITSIPSQEIKKEVKEIDLKKLHIAFSNKMKSYKPASKRRAAIDRITQLFNELESNNVKNADKIILGCFVSEKTIAKITPKSSVFFFKPFNRLSKFERKLNTLLINANVSTKEQENIVLVHYVEYTAQKLELRH